MRRCGLLILIIAALLITLCMISFLYAAELHPMCLQWNNPCTLTPPEGTCQNQHWIFYEKDPDTGEIKAVEGYGIIISLWGEHNKCQGNWDPDPDCYQFKQFCKEKQYYFESNCYSQGYVSQPFQHDGFNCYDQK